MANTNQEKPPPEWARSFSVPQSKPAFTEPEELAELIRTKKAGKDFVIVDVRRNDFEDVFVKNAINLPAHSFYQTLPATLTILSEIPQVIFYCNSCSLGGRGPRTAAWYQDALDAQGITTSQARVLRGGIKNWAAAYGGEVDLSVKL